MMNKLYPTNADDHALPNIKYAASIILRFAALHENSLV